MSAALCVLSALLCRLQAGPGRGLAASGPIGWGPDAGKTFAVEFPNLLHQVVSFQRSLFLVRYAGVLNLLTFRACCRC